MLLPLAVALAAIAGPSSQTRPAPSPQPSVTPTPLVFGAEANIVHVDAVVTDRDGRQVTDLRAEDFEIESDGKKHRAVIATYVPLVAEDGDAPRPRGGKIEAKDVRRVMAFLIARPVIESMGGSNMAARLPGAERLDKMFRSLVAREVKPNDVVAIVNFDSPKRLLTQFTSDRVALENSVATLRKDWTNPGVPPVFIMPRSLGPLVRYCLDVIDTAKTIVGRLRELPGRRMLFMGSGILRFTDGVGDAQGFNDVGREAKALVELANRAGVTIYGISPNGPSLLVPDIAAAGAPAVGPVAAGGDFSEALGYLADGTGGSTIENTNLLGENLAKVMELNRGYYVLGYDPGEAPRSLPRKVKVRVSRERTKVVARPQVYDTNEATSSGTMASGGSLGALLDSPLASSGVLVRVWPHVRWTGARTGQMESVIEIDPSTVDLRGEDSGPSFDLDLVLRVIDEKGNVVKAEHSGMRARLRGDPQRPVRFAVQADLPSPGFYQADVAIKDKRSGRMGNATAITALPDLSEKKDSLLVSIPTLRPVTTGRSLPASVFPEGATVRATMVIAHAELGGESQTARLKVEVRILRDGGVVRTPEPAEMTASQAGLVHWESDISLDGLEGGDYVVEVTATDLRGKASRSVRTEAAFRIEAARIK